MNKNFIFLALIFSVTINDAFTGDRRSRTTRRAAPVYNATDSLRGQRAQHIAQQNKARDQRANRRTMIKEQPKALEAITTIIDLCFASQFDQAAELIKQKNINVLTDSRGYNILQIACELYPFAEDENIDLAATLAFLIEQGANPNHRNNENQTILHVTCQNDLGQQAHAVLDLILQHLDPVFIDSIDRHGRHAFHYACLNSSDATSYFIQHNIGQAFLVHRDHQNMTPMCLAAASNSNQLTELVNFRASTGAGPTEPPLHWAAANNMTSVVTGLIRNGHNVNATDQDGYTALHFTAGLGNTETVQALLNVPGIDVNASRHGNTALHFAAKNGHTVIALALLATQNININATNQDGFTALHLAARIGHLESVQALLNAGINVNTATPRGTTALHDAVLHGNLAIVQALLNAQNININAAAQNGDTALHLAAGFGNTETVQALINAGANVNTAAQRGITALHITARLGNAETVRALINAGADVNTAVQGNITALHIAAGNGHFIIVQVLLAVPGINVNATTINGLTAAEVARTPEIRQLILDAATR